MATEERTACEIYGWNFDLPAEMCEPKIAEPEAPEPTLDDAYGVLIKELLPDA